MKSKKVSDLIMKIYFGENEIEQIQICPEKEITNHLKNGGDIRITIGDYKGNNQPLKIICEAV
jgi:hypothetical protein